ncbi:MAG: hypothetical protein US13_C0002G0015 [candidate division TM6 bacterium GW2011_GWE2_36_25]|nr:MAG: hypothetical protein US03_C0002G0015 [candidate division TM6 bacterium GW2011_GWF2_36_131]KKQ03449.1 MAG: hypothetical protein US13_C0002G0015 [candidate division TM6 bacterium GW2011_GWE2_36_25]KKQ20277.1 MAG: hypothetical protein US32_C0001G0174 [candidate division TM6 bacterium GW2011_GWA2_36_9]
MKREHDIHCCGSKTHALYDEFICHFPYAVLSVAIGLLLLSFFTPSATDVLVMKQFHRLFHSFHFMHIMFASAGAIQTFFRYSNNYVKGILVGTLSPAFFCMLSDILMPYVGGEMLGVKMRLHICFVSEFTNIGLFLLIGVITGFILRFHVERQHSGSLFTRWLHFGHILLSSMASMFYMVSYGFISWYHQMGMVFVMLILAVVIPCTFSDVVVPFVVAKDGRK